MVVLHDQGAENFGPRMQSFPRYTKSTHMIPVFEVLVSIICTVKVSLDVMFVWMAYVSSEVPIMFDVVETSRGIQIIG